jgi:hypothetical protein
MKTLKSMASFAYRLWMRFARALAIVNTHVLLTLVFFLIIGPVALVVWLLRKDFLDRTMRSPGTYWKPKQAAVHDLESASRQF